MTEEREQGMLIVRCEIRREEEETVSVDSRLRAKERDRI
jgi:hypothetical protein